MKVYIHFELNMQFKQPREALLCLTFHPATKICLQNVQGILPHKKIVQMDLKKKKKNCHKHMMNQGRYNSYFELDDKFQRKTSFKNRLSDHSFPFVVASACFFPQWKISKWYSTSHLGFLLQIQKTSCRLWGAAAYP